MESKFEIIDMITYREYLDDGSFAESVIDPMPPPEGEREEDHPGMSWHPILEKWVPDADINKRMFVSESEIFPLQRSEEDSPPESE